MKSFVGKMLRGKVVQDILCFFGVHVEGETTTEFRGWGHVGTVKCGNCGVTAKLIIDIESCHSHGSLEVDWRNY